MTTPTGSRTTFLSIRLLPAALVLASAGCATYWQGERLEEQVALLVENTRRETMEQVFGKETAQVRERIDALDDTQRRRLDYLMSEYQRGSASLEEVRGGVVKMLGGGEREVTSARGIWVRDMRGEKIKAIRRGTNLENCRQLSAQEIPSPILESKALREYHWGQGQLDGETVVFPWELTMSAFAREIVVNTAKRTAEEFMRMGGEREWSRPIHIQVTTDETGKGFKVRYPEEGEIYLTTDAPAETP